MGAIVVGERNGWGVGGFGVENGVGGVLGGCG